MSLHKYKGNIQWGCVVKWEKRLTINWSVLHLNPIKISHCFFEQDTLPSLLSTGWFQEQIQMWLT